MAEKKDKYSFTDIKRLGEEKRESYDITMKDLKQDKTVKINGKNVNIGGICRTWSKRIDDNAPNPNDPKLRNLHIFIYAAYVCGGNLNDQTTWWGMKWNFLLTFYWPFGKNFRLTMDSTNNELTRLLTRE